MKFTKTLIRFYRQNLEEYKILIKMMNNKEKQPETRIIDRNIKDLSYRLDQYRGSAFFLAEL